MSICCFTIFNNIQKIIQNNPELVNLLTRWRTSRSTISIMNTIYFKGKLRLAVSWINILLHPLNWVFVISVLQMRVFQLAGNCKAEFQASETSRKMLKKINWDLSELGPSPQKLWCLYCVYSNNMNNTKKPFSNSQAI